MEIGKIQKVLYDQVRPVLKNKNVDPEIKKKLTCRYICFMANVRSGKKRESELRPKYKEILALIEQSHTEA